MCRSSESCKSPCGQALQLCIIQQHEIGLRLADWAGKLQLNAGSLDFPQYICP